MASQLAAAYRSALREFKRSPILTKNKNITSSFRSFFENCRPSDNPEVLQYDVPNLISFMRSQREYKALLERYNPLVDLTTDERIHATARRVGLDMPITHKPQNEE